MARKSKKQVSSLKVLLVVVLINLGIYAGYNNEKFKEIFLSLDETITETESLKTIEKKEITDDLEIHYIDVGQGDAILLENNGKYMLIDAGPTSSKEKLKQYLEENEVKELDYIIATHAHEDHIGGMTTVINNFKVNNLLVSKYISTSKIYENFILAAQKKELQFYAPSNNEKFEFADAEFIILADGNNDMEDMNNHSIIVKVIYDENEFLFMGDAEEELELDLINSGFDLSADVIKIGHHGSDSSSSSIFIEKVNPKYAVISLGQNNSYGHPCKSVMQILNNKQIPVYRTDENSNIVLSSDGKEIKFNVQPGSYSYVSAR